MSSRLRGNTNALCLRVRLREIEPPIWRLLLVERTTTLHELHRMIQLLFEWYDYHLYQFTVRGQRFEAPDPEAEGLNSTRARLSDFGLKAGDSFEYVYDFGDDWIHDILVEKGRRADPGWLPWLLDGQRAGPPEDCGGVWGYEELITALNTPLDEVDPDEEVLSLRQWVGPDYDPERFDVRAARHALLLSAAWGAWGRAR